MSRYIDADALKASYIVTSTTTNSLCHLYVSIEDINNAPSIDIVRCKACRWGKPYSEKQLECDALGLGGLKFPDEFCSHGERREP